ncbi:hypothetical protein [Magnetofaba australis]|uniref:Uncharacterized protein n=1 Tax=Magnetofaba australis IT-1 TaxID=1434232 RepID=W0LMY6_9PROT|nr:hypothetical protein [Magnetofaba australis]AHG23909.1 hypothetical protein MIIT1_02819 [Magnetofaba australis IT-1]OSM08656.1 hypothetical protein MAIT1_02819 [Magnetofaba australis IT-1]
MDATPDILREEALCAQQQCMPVEQIERPQQSRKARLNPRRKPRAANSKRRLGKEAVKAGMSITLALSMLTGLRVVKPFSLHAPVSWLFVAFVLVHTLVYEIPNSARKRETV